MLQKKALFDIGEGLFSDDPVPVEIEFTMGTAVFDMKPLTSELGVKFEAEEIDLTAITTSEEAQKASCRILEEIVYGWDNLKDSGGKDIPYTKENRDKLATSHQLVVLLIGAATDLASTKRKEEEKN